MLLPPLKSENAKAQDSWSNQALSRLHPNPTQAASTSLKNSRAQKRSPVNVLSDTETTDFI